MKFFKKLRAIFNFKGQQAEMQLRSAEIRGDKVFLHPADESNHTFYVSGKAIDILIDPAVALTEDDFMVIENEKLAKLQEQMEIDSTSPIEMLLQPKTPPAEKQPPKLKDPPKQAPEAKQNPKEGPKETQKPVAKPVEKRQSSKPSKPVAVPAYQGPKMRTVSMRLYPEEYDFLMSAIEEKGYKKTEYLLACVAAAKKKSMETNYQKYYAQRIQRRKEQRAAAKRAAEDQKNHEKSIGT